MEFYVDHTYIIPQSTIVSLPLYHTCIVDNIAFCTRYFFPDRVKKNNNKKRSLKLWNIESNRNTHITSRIFVYILYVDSNYLKSGKSSILDAASQP